MPRKRTRDEMEASEPPAQSAPVTPLITRIRNMWEFASVMQFIHTFGKAVRIDNDFDIQDFEEECLKPGYSEKLEEIGLSLLKWISSFRGLEYVSHPRMGVWLTNRRYSNWDDYTRRQYLAKAPHLNPYGDDEEPKRFREFDIFLKIRVLHQLTVWTFFNPDRMRERMPDQFTEARQTEWRVEDFGWDRDDRTYYLLDDDRLYRRTEPPLPPLPKAKPKATSKKAQAAKRRASKRARLEKSATPDVQEEEAADVDDEKPQDDSSGTPSGSDVNTLGGYTWECVAITLAEYQTLVESMKRSKDPNEQALRDRLVDEVIPVIEAAEEKQRRKIERRERELLAMEKMATAKRSSRIAGKYEREKAEREALETERKRAADLAAAHREQERQEQMENERQSRMMTREQRIKDREYKRILAEEELARAAAEQEAIERGEARGSERQVKERLARNKAQLDELNNQEEEWTFDCSGCGVHGKNVDDGSHSISCERCNVWQHSKCLNISEKDAERDDFNFLCRDCRRKEEEAKRPKISLKFKTGLSSSPPQPSASQPVPPPQKYNFTGVEVPRYPQPSPPSTNGHQPSPATYGPPPPSAGQNGYSRPAYSPNPATQRQYPFVISPYQNAGSPPPPMAPNSTAYPPLQPGQQWGYPPPQHPYQRPGSSGQQYAAPQQNGIHNGYSYPGGYPPQYSQSHQVTPNARPPSSGGSSRPSSSHGQINGQTPAARLPSPVINRPVMSPSQGNYDVGPLAGIPPYNNQAQRTPNLTNGTPAPVGRQPTSSSSPLMSGLSPSKNSSPRPYQLTPQAHATHQTHPSQTVSDLPPPSAVPIKPATSPGQITSQRSVSGTPVIPPAEKLAPSPEHVQQGPQPTPSKQEKIFGSFGADQSARAGVNGSTLVSERQSDVVADGTTNPAPLVVQAQSQPQPVQQVDQSG